MHRELLCREQHAVVGKQQVRIGRNMQWLRIDTYFEAI